MLPAVAGAQPLMRYNAVVESTYLLDRCGELTPARRAYLEKLKRLAQRSLDYTPEQWAAQDAALAGDLPRLNPSVPKERCEELVSSIDQEMRGAQAK
jgi:hypothetical protein